MLCAMRNRSRFNLRNKRHQARSRRTCPAIFCGDWGDYPNKHVQCDYHCALLAGTMRMSAECRYIC